MADNLDFDLITPLQAEAAQLLAAGQSPTAVRTALELPRSTFASWREDTIFADYVQAQRIALEGGERPADDDTAASVSRLKATAKASFRKNRK